MSQDKPTSVVVFSLLYKDDAKKLVQLSKEFQPVYQIANHFTCGKCKTEIFSVEYLQDCPQCGEFLWTNAAHTSC